MARLQSAVDPWFISQRLSALEARWAGALSFASAPGSNPLLLEGGVLPGGANDGLAVVSNGTTLAPRIGVSPGRCIIPDLVQGGWGCTLPAGGNINLTAPPSTNPRVDLVVARVYGGSELSEADTGFFVDVIDGTPAGSPTAPNVPSRAIPLADARVNTNGTVVITPRRTFTRAAGGNRLSENDTGRPGSYIGDTRVSTAGVLEVWQGTRWVATGPRLLRAVRVTGALTLSGIGSTDVNIPRLALTNVPMVSGDWYKLYLRISAQGSVADSSYEFRLRRSSPWNGSSGGPLLQGMAWPYEVLLGGPTRDKLMAGIWQADTTSAAENVYASCRRISGGGTLDINGISVTSAEMWHLGNDPTVFSNVP
jgi:hypothetical protein